MLAVPEYGREPLPFVLVGNEAFPLKSYLIQLYSKPRSRMIANDEEVGRPTL